MCYGWYEDAAKTVKSDVAQEKPQETAPEAASESRVRPERLRFWTFPTGRRVRVTEEETVDRTLEKV